MIPIYSAEKDIAEQVAKASVTFCSQITHNLDMDVNTEAMTALAKVLAKDGLAVTDLVPFTSILCTVGTTNKNDDHLLAEVAWPARHSPVNKQINYEHNERDIIGHMSGSFGMDTDGKIIADDSPIDLLPEKFHIVDNGYLYNSWAAEDLKYRMTEILASIAKGELFVSMEALFQNFDYLLTDTQTNASELVRRDAETAFLTKYLRIYGGDGVYKDKKIARVLRYMTFCGKGIVKRPANPESIILNDFVFSSKQWPTKAIDMVWMPALDTTEKDNGDIKTMSATATELKPIVDQATLDKVEALTKALEQSQKEKAEANAKAEADAKANAAKELADLRDQVKAKEAEVASLNEKLVTATEIAKQSEVKIAELEAGAKSLADEIAKNKLEQKVASRVAQLTSAGKSKEDAEKMVAKFDSLDDTAFAELATLIAAAFKPFEKKDKDDDEEDSAKSAVEDLDTAKVTNSLVGNGESEKGDEFRSLAALFATELRSTASLKSENL
jgi:hypothetical protein